ncbi:hypothetical protein LQ772_09075 [Frateuria edaphi]|uniref:hypothetical protein n=1 Tax=Frateuria edaphi TaxID=2898793 RepID=UPI001E33ADBD|nr:hypothetical protein [Frateuria edaphi]UGB44161.1 hypothetical protein LQ772_09075 [Frateuria edaphi]
MLPPSRRLLLCLGLLLVALWTNPAWADVDLTAKVVAMPGVRLQQVTLHIGEDGKGGLALKLHAARADVGAMGWRRVGLDLEGALSRDLQMRWLLDGTIALRGAPGGALGNSDVHLVIDERANTLQADIAQATATASAWVPLDQTSHAQITLKNLPAQWLAGLLGTVWSGRPTGGRLDAELALDVHDNGIQSSGEFSMDGVGFDTPTGTLAGQGVDGTGRLGIDTEGGPARFTVDATLRGGELLLGPIYAKLPDHAVQLNVAAVGQGGALAISRLRVNDADALQLDGALAFDAKGNLDKLRLERFQARFPAAYDRYGAAWLDTLGLHGMKVTGALSGNLDLREGGPRGFAFTADHLNLATADGRLAIDDLNGGLDWSADADRPTTNLGWRALRVYRLPFGSARAQWRSRGGTLGLTQPLAVALLGGTVQMSQLDWRPAAARGQRLETSLAVTGVDMASFSKAMGWPQFPGTLGGAIPSLRLVDDTVELAGGLSVNVFNGFVDITQLALTQPFGPSPVLAADVGFRQLDLGSITSVFDFGSITGPLHGSIDNLRLVDWQPVAFEAHLLADEGGRISQRAVNNLTAVGGGGIAAGLQGAVLKLFKTFGYARIGLNCALTGTVCHMSGLENTGDGYTIVDGSGLPHLKVIGHQHEVDWPTLVSRLKAATEGGGPQIR